MSKIESEIKGFFSSLKGKIGGLFNKIFSPAVEHEGAVLFADAVELAPQALTVLQEAALLFPRTPGVSIVIGDLRKIISKFDVLFSVPGEPGQVATSSQIVSVLQAAGSKGLHDLLPDASPTAINQAVSFGTTTIIAHLKTGEAVPAPAPAAEAATTEAAPPAPETPAPTSTSGPAAAEAPGTITDAP